MIYLLFTLVLSIVCNYPIYRMIAADAAAHSPTRHPAPDIVCAVPYLSSYDPSGLT